MYNLSYSELFRFESAVIETIDTFAIHTLTRLDLWCGDSFFIRFSKTNLSLLTLILRVESLTRNPPREGILLFDVEGDFKDLCRLHILLPGALIDQFELGRARTRCFEGEGVDPAASQRF